ncbi:hypothetical protein ACJMK2_028031 [Sinanodonta woodiana]|uniref:Uncharacterized protein n=1 Tax=Sinanodonta woodiana TaxID=1069815 RepID=A0ABD3X635_SINWO
MQTSLVPGVSANSWLTPLKLAAKTTGTVSYVTNSGCSLVFNSKIRVNSASALMGRRHFEVGKQDIDKNEYIQGIQIKSRNFARTNSSTLTKSSSSQTGKTQANGKDVKQKFRLPQRPQTSPAGCVTVLARDQNEIQVDVLIIRSLSITASRNNVNREKLVINGDNDDLNNIKEIKSACKRRIKSAPIRESSSADNEKTLTEFESRARKHTPGYWRNTSFNNRSQNTSLDQEEKRTPSDVSKRHRGSFLQSLFRRNSDLRHSVDCPYKCRGCFKACLVSEKFVDNYLGKRVSDSSSVSNAYLRNKDKRSECFKQYDCHKYLDNKALHCSQTTKNS